MSTSDLAAPVTHVLTDLVDGLAAAQVRGDPSVEIRELAYDHRRCPPGALFFCVPGGRVDGHAFAGEAVRAGAVALVVERPLEAGVPKVVVPSVRAAMGPIAARFFDHPADAILAVAVTGTNGKTTTTHLLGSIFRAASLVPGVVGTTGAIIDDRAEPIAHTTPEAPDVHRLLRRMVERGVRAVAMEVSSHALVQGRVDGIVFDCAVFTNLSQDHLDYHGTMEEYFRAKARLFRGDHAVRAVVGIDTDYGRRLAAETSLPVATFGTGEADFRATEVEVTASGIAFSVEGVRVRSPLLGRHNVENCLAAFAAARSVGISRADAVRGIASVARVPGRMEQVSCGQPFAVIVDYAHTPDGVAKLLDAVRPLTTGAVIAVLGCGGDRDPRKRSPMGEAATRRADLTILTSDNPRSEDPNAILHDMEAGAIAGGGAFEVEPDRRRAIRKALERARAGDVVVVAGKGHETAQEISGRKVPFDDRVVAAEELRNLGVTG